MSLEGFLCKNESKTRYECTRVESTRQREGMTSTRLIEVGKGREGAASETYSAVTSVTITKPRRPLEIPPPVAGSISPGRQGSREDYTVCFSRASLAAASFSR